MKTLHQFVFGFLSILILISCAASKSIPNQFKTKLPENVTYSVGFESLWYDLGQETASLKSLSKYEPSEKLIAQYGLKRLDDKKKTVVVTGYLEVSSDFDANAIGLMGGQITSLSKNIVSFTCPIVCLPELLQVKGINNIELPTRIIIRKPITKNN
jgi:hypothetical protein